MGEFLIELLERYLECKWDGVLIVLAVTYDFYMAVSLISLIARG